VGMISTDFGITSKWAAAIGDCIDEALRN